ncbi:hypothetical protein GCM10022224_041470 [Nonomuraea antimicrobica]|uniref:Uncharacterized protein n=1 Tax=Nonomuraea antimicrobica TaxID=561173 RepID=A0ABP7BXP0_9ACTN
MESVPRRIRTAIVLILSPAATGTAAILITLFAYAQSELVLPSYQDAREISAEMWRSAASQAGEEFRGHLRWLGTFFAVATVAFGVTAWKVRFGTRRPALLLTVATGLTAVFVAMLWPLFHGRPNTFFIVRESAERTGVIDLDRPGWYAPALGVLLVAGAAALVRGLVLLTGGDGVSWLTRDRHPPFEPDSPPLWVSPSRQAGVLMSLTPALLLLYAAVNYAGSLAGDLSERREPVLLSPSLLSDMQVHLQYLAIPAVPVVVGGLILLLGKGRGRRMAGALAGILGLPYAAALLQSALHFSDTSLFHNYVATEGTTAWWTAPAVAATGLVIFLLHAAGLALLFRPPVLQHVRPGSAAT